MHYVHLNLKGSWDVQNTLRQVDASGDARNQENSSLP